MYSENNKETKICKRCGRELPLDRFRLATGQFGNPYYRGSCKECEAKYDKEYKKKKTEKCNFEAVSYMYMRRALYVHFRKDKAQKRSSENEGDISLDEIDICVSDSKAMETVSNLEYMETMKEITTQLSEEQSMIGGLLQVNRL